MAETPRILAFAGSLRTGSSNKKILAGASLAHATRALRVGRE